jgi:putative nucleotidyltransferase with HDIG domain
MEGLKPFPASVQRVMDELGRPAFTVSAVVTLIEEDPPFAVKVVRLANSPAFVGRQACKSVHEAVVRLGRDRTKEAAIMLGCMKMFRDAGGLGRKVGTHCVRVASLVRSLTDLTHRSVSGAFLAGLLHDVGKLVLLQAGHEPYLALQSGPMPAADTAHIRERALLGYDHAVLGAHLLHSWDIPDPIPQAVAWHHQPARAFAANNEVSLAVALVRLADVLDECLDRSPSPAPSTLMALAASRECAQLSISARDLERAWPTLRLSAQETAALT